MGLFCFSLFSCVPTPRANESQRVQFCQSKNQDINRLATRKSQRKTNFKHCFSSLSPAVFISIHDIPQEGQASHRLGLRPERGAQSLHRARGWGRWPASGRCPMCPARDSTQPQSQTGWFASWLHKISRVSNTYKDDASQICWEFCVEHDFLKSQVICLVVLVLFSTCV